MKILCLAADLVPGTLGGAEMHAVEVIKRLSQKHQITVVVGADDSIKKLLPKASIITITYPKIPNFYGLSYIICAYQIILRQLKPEDVDLIWAKQSFPQAPVAALLKNAWHKPVYITAQNPRLLTEELVVKGPLKFFQLIFAALMNSLIKWAYRQADLVAAVSSYSETAAKEFGAGKTTIIPNGFDDSVFKPAPAKHNLFTIVTTSSLIPRNGIDTLIQAVLLLPDSCKWQLTIAGDGPDRSKLERMTQPPRLEPGSVQKPPRLEPGDNQAKPRGLIDSRIHFLGRVSNQDIPTLLHQADLFIRPSRWEGFGVSFIEAMASGVPVIATPQGGIPDFIQDHHNGVLVPPDDPSKLAAAIQELIENPTLRQQLADHGYQTAVSRYTWDTIANQVETAFKNLV